MFEEYNFKTTRPVVDYYIMADTHSKETRSYNMSRIRSTNTKPEMLVRKFLHKNGFRYRLNVKDLPGKPDIVLPKYRTVIFIHGCFWHGHEGCKYYILPKSNKSYWIPKIQKNVERDLNVFKITTKQGWNVITIWECELKTHRLETLNSIVGSIKNIKV